MKTLNGQSLKTILISGSNNLYNHYPEVDALNVFPVPDGDTGMNMNLTLTSGSKEISNRSDESAYEIAKAFSRGLLMGARGNSGVITSQIFRGFSKGLDGIEEADAFAFSAAMQRGVEVAYKAVVNPVEGTILTVIRESSQFLADNVKENMSIEKCLDLMLQEARESLKRTPELLPVLKEALRLALDQRQVLVPLGQEAAVRRSGEGDLLPQRGEVRVGIADPEAAVRLTAI